MKKTNLIIAALIALTGVAQAVQMSFDDNGWDTVTQTYNTPENFSPGSPSVIPITFAQFDTMGGTRTLASVTIGITQRTWGGSYEADNDSALGGLADGTVNHGISGKIATSLNSLYFFPTGSGNTLLQQISQNIHLGADDGDGAGFQAGGVDYVKVDGPTQANALIASATGTASDSRKNAYVGNENLSMDYEVTQSSGYVGTGAISYSGTYANSSAEITVTYNYTPEPTSLALFAMGCAILGMRRRPRSTLKI